MSSEPTESSSCLMEPLGSVSSFSAAYNVPDVADKSESLSSGSASPLEALERDESDTFTLSAVVVVTNEPADEARGTTPFLRRGTTPFLRRRTTRFLRNDRLPAQEATPEEELETATLPALAAVSNDGPTAAPEEEESDTATLPPVAAYGHGLEETRITQDALPPTALWTAVPAGDQASAEEGGEALSTPKEPEAFPPDSSKTVVWRAVPKKANAEQARAHQTTGADPLYTAIWPAASRSAPPPAATALHPSLSSSQNVVLTISRGRAILLTLLISFLNILLGVFIVFALLYQLNGTLIYQSPAPVREVRTKVTQLERQANQLVGEVEELQERAKQLEAQQKAFEDATRQIGTLQNEQKKVQNDLNQAQEQISTLQEESSELQRELTDLVAQVTLFNGFLAGLQDLLQEARPLPSETPTLTSEPTIQATSTPIPSATVTE